MGSYREVVQRKILEDLIDSSKLNAGDRDLIMNTNIIHQGVTELCNLLIEKVPNGKISLSTLGGSLYPQSIMPYICTIDDDEMWLHPEQFSKVTKNVTWKKPPKIIGLLPSESNIVDLLHPTVANDINPSEELQDYYLPDLVQPLHKRITCNKFGLVSDIVTELQNSNPDKWSTLTPEKCYNGILKDASTMMASCTIKDIQCLSRIMEMHTGRMWYSPKFIKAVNVNIISAFDGHVIIATHNKGSKNQTKHVKSLFIMCKDVLKDSKYPLICLQVSYAHSVHEMKKNEYYSQSQIEKYGYVPNDDATEVEHPFEYFSYPEFSEECQQLEFCTLDYTHILMNM